MAKIESIAFSLGLVMAGVLMVSTLASTGVPADPRQQHAQVAGQAALRAA